MRRVSVYEIWDENKVVDCWLKLVVPVKISFKTQGRGEYVGPLTFGQLLIKHGTNQNERELTQ